MDSAEIERIVKDFSTPNSYGFKRELSWRASFRSRRADKEGRMTMFYLVSLFLAGTVIALVLFGLAYWLYDRAPKGSRRFGSVRVGSYFTLRPSGNSAVVCQKVSHSRYTPLSAPGKTRSRSCFARFTSLQRGRCSLTGISTAGSLNDPRSSSTANASCQIGTRKPIGVKALCVILWNALRPAIGSKNDQWPGVLVQT
jgi:hypothetical protein